MFEVPVLVPEGRASCAITLSVPVSALLGGEDTCDWAGHARLRPGPDGGIEAEGAPSDPTRLEAFLTDLQAGLLYAGIAGLRPRPEAQETPLPGLARLARRVDLTGPDGRVAILALWGPDVTLKEAVRAAAAGRYAHLILLRGVNKTRPRLSVLVPGRDAERALAELTELGTLRVGRPYLVIEPDPALAAPAEPRRRKGTGTALKPGKRSAAPKPRKSRKISAVPKGEPAPGTDWADPFLPALSPPEIGPAPVLELDRLSRELCVSSPPGTPPDRVRYRILRVLIEAWRLGLGTDRRISRVFRYPSRGLHDLLRDRARAIGTLLETGDRERRLRALVRVSALQAWSWGQIMPRSFPKDPPRMFREERSVLARSVPEQELALLMRVAEGDVPDPADLAGLRRRGLLGGEGPPVLTGPARELLRELSEEVSGPLPSLLDLLGPTLEALLALDPRTGPKEAVEEAPPTALDPALEKALGPLLTAAEDLALQRPGDGTDALQDPLRDLLMWAYRTGRGGPRPPRQDAPVRVPGEMGAFLTERARALCALTRADREAGEVGPVRALLRESLIEVWGVGAGPAPLRAPPPRFREECSAPLRPLSLPARAALIALNQEEEGRHERGALNELVRAGLLLSGGSRLLTPAGRTAAITELTHRSRPDPAPPPPEPPDPGLARIRVPPRAVPELDRLAARVTTRPGRGRPPSPDTFADRVLKALKGAFRLGRSSPDRDAGPRTPLRATRLLERLAGEVTDLTREDRERDGPEAARRALRDACAFAYRMGAAHGGP